MRLESLFVDRVRNLSEVQLEPSPELNIISGANAAGKTALLESIYILSKARSFRTPHIRNVIQHQSEKMVVSADLWSEQGIVKTGIQKSPKETLIKYGGERVEAVSKQAKNVGIQTVLPDSVKLLTGSPKDRRKWLDWAMFHVEQDYLQVWYEYHHALRNRNALLRRGAKDIEFTVWEEKMSSSSESMFSMWKTYLANLQEKYLLLAEDTYLSEVSFRTKQEKYQEEGFQEYLQKNRPADLKQGFTQQGPHKLDLEFLINGKPLNSVFSRGQIKRFVTLLSIAEAKYLAEEKDNPTILLVDELTAELDKEAAESIFQTLYQENLQMFITSTEAENIPKSSKETAVFHVEQGGVKRC